MQKTPPPPLTKEDKELLASAFEEMNLEIEERAAREIATFGNKTEIVEMTIQEANEIVDQVGDFFAGGRHRVSIKDASLLPDTLPRIRQAFIIREVEAIMAAKQAAAKGDIERHNNIMKHREILCALGMGASFYSEIDTEDKPFVHFINTSFKPLLSRDTDMPEELQTRARHLMNKYYERSMVAVGSSAQAESAMTQYAWSLFGVDPIVSAHDQHSDNEQVDTHGKPVTAQFMHLEGKARSPLLSWYFWAALAFYLIVALSILWSIFGGLL